MVAINSTKLTAFSHEVRQQLCHFSDLKVKQQANAIKQKLVTNKTVIQQRLADLHTDTVSEQQANDLIMLLDSTEVELEYLFAPLRHLHGVAQTPEIRSAYQELLPLLSDYTTWLNQNESLYQILVTVVKADYFKHLAQARQVDIKRSIKDFRLSGVALPEHEKQALQEINQRLSQLTTDFSNHVLDATESWQQHITDKQQLSGLLDSHLDYLHDQARQKKLSGYLVTLDWPAYHAIMQYADNRELRQQVYTAFITRASDHGDNPAFDNTQTMQEILALRHQSARLLGFDQYADYALQTRMAASVTEVMTFLYDLVGYSLNKAEQEFQELTDFVQTIHPDIIAPEPWDIAYYSEKLRQNLFQLSPEQLRPYFPLERVLSGTGTIVESLFGVYFKDITDQVDVYHKDVRFLLLYDADKPIGGIYLDLFARQGKRDGAWMDECMHHCRLQQKLHLPVAFLATNFTPPIQSKPALLLHEEVETLLHELGHSLHHILTQVEVLGASGINNVAWDAVELPSQLLENWCWQKQGLDLLAAHYKTQEPIPEAWLQQLLAAKQFHSGMQTVRQLEFALFDMMIHSAYPAGQTADTTGDFIQCSLDKARAEVRVTPVYQYDRFAHAFSHIFAGGYAAGYYSYKWAEVLSADVFSRFREQGIFDQQTGRLFLSLLLSQGGVKPMKDLFIAFMGRKPDIKALLKQDGLVE